VRLKEESRGWKDCVLEVRFAEAISKLACISL
jgi:hypothetical protein